MDNSVWSSVRLWWLMAQGLWIEEFNQCGILKVSNSIECHFSITLIYMSSFVQNISIIKLSVKTQGNNNDNNLILGSSVIF